MRRQLTLAAVSFVLSACAAAVPTPAGPGATVGPATVRVHSDTAGGRTQYVTDAADLRATGALETPPLRLAVGGSCRGVGCAPDSFLLYLSRRAPDLQIVQDTRVVLHADGVQVVAEQARYSSRPTALGVTEETLVLPLSARQLRTLAAAESVLGSVGSVWQFEVTPSAREVLRRMAALASVAP